MFANVLICRCAVAQIDRLDAKPLELLMVIPHVLEHIRGCGSRAKNSPNARKGFRVR
jgi:hypothetical protein